MLATEVHDVFAHKILACFRLNYQAACPDSDCRFAAT
jgi:hypothetical protein